MSTSGPSITGRRSEDRLGVARQDSSAADGPFSPAGLKVLVVDDDPMCLKVVSAMLQRCNYEVTTKSNGQEALALLRQRNQEDAGGDQFDLVLSDVYMPDMDGFKLLEHIGLELELPVIMMSSNGDTNVVLRGVTHGAVDFLIKPVRIEELRNLWQHVVRRKSIHLGRGGEDSGADMDGDSRTHGTKRKGELEVLRAEHEGGAGNKKPRVVWSVEMHGQFVNAVNTLGIDKAVPKRILELMNVEGLTRENVASHLQKYRLYLKRVEGVAGKGGKSSSVGGHKHHHHHFGSSMDVMPSHTDGSGLSGSVGAMFAQQQQQQQHAAAAAAAAMAGGAAGFNPAVMSMAANPMAAAQMAAWQQQQQQQQHHAHATQQQFAFQAAVAAAVAASGQSIAAMSSFMHPSQPFNTTTTTTTTGGVNAACPPPSLPPTVTHPPFANGMPSRPPLATTTTTPGYTAAMTTTHQHQLGMGMGMPPTSSAGPSSSTHHASIAMDNTTTAHLHHHHNNNNSNAMINHTTAMHTAAQYNAHTATNNNNGQSSSGEMQPLGGGDDVLLVGRATGSSSPIEQPHQDDTVSATDIGIAGNTGVVLHDHDVLLPAMKDHPSLVVDESLLPDIHNMHHDGDSSMMHHDHHGHHHHANNHASGGVDGGGFVMPPSTKSHHNDPDRDFLDMFIEGMENDDKKS